MDQTMPYVPNLESSSQITDETTVQSEQQQERVEIDATPASAVKQRRNRRKKRFSQAYTVNSDTLTAWYGPFLYLHALTWNCTVVINASLK